MQCLTYLLPLFMPLIYVEMWIPMGYHFKCANDDNAD